MNNPATESGETPGKPEPAILVVEDEAIVAADVCGTLRRLGYRVAGTAMFGENAIELAGELHPDLVLMDIHLAGRMDGIESAVQIHGRYDIPVIFLTAFADTAMIERAKIAVPYGYVIKPFEERALHSALETALNKSCMDRKLKESEDRLRKLNDELEARVASRTASLEQQLRFVQQLIDTIPAPVYYKNARGEYLGCNNAFEVYSGISRREIIGKRDSAFFPPDIAILSEEKDTQIMTRPGIQVYQAKFPHADHRYRDVIFKKGTFSDPGSGVVGFIGVMIDITDRIIAEEARKESEERLRSIADDMTELVWRRSPDQTCTYANPAFLRYFGRTGKETIGFLFSPPVHPDDAVKVRDHLASLTPDHPAGALAYRVILPDKGVRIISWNTRAFFDASGGIREYQSVGHETG